MDIETNKTYISRNVTFHEDIFPYTKDEATSYSDFFTSSTADVQPDNEIHVPESVPTPPGSSTVVNAHSVSVDNTSQSAVKDNKRKTKLPAYLQDFYCNVSESDTEIPYPLSAYMSFDGLSDEYRAYICSVALHPEPTSFRQAKKFDEWLQASGSK